MGLRLSRRQQFNCLRARLIFAEESDGGTAVRQMGRTHKNPPTQKETPKKGGRKGGQRRVLTTIGTRMSTKHLAGEKRRNQKTRNSQRPGEAVCMTRLGTAGLRVLAPSTLRHSGQGSGCAIKGSAGVLRTCTS